MSILQSLFGQVLEVSLAMCMVIAVLLLLRPVLGKRYRVGAFYWVWLLVALRLAVPLNFSLIYTGVNIQVPDSVVYQLPESEENSAMSNDLVVGTDVDAAEKLEALEKDPAVGVMDASSTGVSLTLMELASFIWVGGAGIFMAGNLLRYAWFRRRIRQRSLVEEREALVLFEQLQKEMQVTRITLAVCPAVPSPLVFGLWKPILLLPKAEYGLLELEAIFRHELVHAKRHDLWYKLLLLITRSVHWMNPLVHLMVRRAAMDLEISCDEAVVSEKSTSFRAQYGHAVLSATEKGLFLPISLTTHFKGGKDTMKERLATIAGKGGKHRGVMLVSVVSFLVVLLAAACSVEGIRASVSAPVEDEEVSDGVGETVGEGKSSESADEGSQDSSESTGKSDNSESAENTENIMATTIQDALTGKGQFVWIGEGAEPVAVNIGQVPDLFNPHDDYMMIHTYTLVDLDGDGAKGAILWVSGVAGDMGGYLVLRQSEGVVYGYRVGYRMFERLKTDGSFYYSDSAGAREGIATIGFSGNTISLNETVSATGQAYVMSHFMINGVEATEEEYNTVREAQDQKVDVQWENFTNPLWNLQYSDM